MTFPFGAHKGKSLINIPTHYLEWTTKNVDDKNLRTAIVQELNNRLYKESVVHEVVVCRKEVLTTSMSRTFNCDYQIHFATHSNTQLSEQYPLSLFGSKLVGIDPVNFKEKWDLYGIWEGMCRVGESISIRQGQVCFLKSGILEKLSYTFLEAL